MEDGLRDVAGAVVCVAGGMVLILVLMEDGLRDKHERRSR